MIRGVAVAAVIVSTTSPALADAGGTKARETKKELYLAEKRGDTGMSDDDRAAWHRELDRIVGDEPEDVVNIFNTWTHEYIAVDPERRRIDKVVCDRFLRCHFTNVPADMDPVLFETLLRAARHFRAARIDIVSGFRSAKYNLMLRKKGREVARNSQHVLGKAVDFRVRGVSVRRLHAWAKSLRLGGVGLYVHSGFIHIDTGPVRYWGGR